MTLQSTEAFNNIGYVVRYLSIDNQSKYSHHFVNVLKFLTFSKFDIFIMDGVVKQHKIKNKCRSLEVQYNMTVVFNI